MAALSAPLSSIPLELYHFDSHLTLYCDNALETVPTLRQLSILTLTQSLVRLQIFKEYLAQEYPVRKHV